MKKSLQIALANDLQVGRYGHVGSSVSKILWDAIFQESGVIPMGQFEGVYGASR